MIVGYSRASAPTVADPNWTSVKLLMGFEGVNGSTVMNDESSAAHGTAIGANPFFSYVSTAQRKFGGSSLFLVGDSIYFGDSTDWAFGSGHFTVEAWIYPTGFSTYQFIVCQFGPGGAGTLGWSLYVFADSVGWNVSTTGADNLQDMLSAAATVTVNQWQHVAVDYDGSKYRLYVNGVMVASSTTARNIYHPAQNLAIGSNSNKSAWQFNGYIDEVRVTKGVARYASDSGFSVPTSAFPRF